MKLDVEGAERTCIDALRSLKDKPRIVTIERNFNNSDLFTSMQSLGYVQYKLVRQKYKSSGSLGTVSGALGALATDCKLGWNWHEMGAYTPAYETDLVQHCNRNGNHTGW